MNLGITKSAIFFGLGAVSVAGAIVTLDFSRDTILRDVAWRTGMEFAGYIEHEFPILEDVIRGTADQAVVETDLQRLASIGDIFRFEFANSAGEPVFTTGSYHPSIDGSEPNHHAHEHDDEIHAAAPSQESHVSVDTRGEDHHAGSVEGSSRDHAASIPAIPHTDEATSSPSHNAAGETNQGHHPVRITSSSDELAHHNFEIRSGDGLSLPDTYAQITHPIAGSNGLLKGTVTLYLDLTEEAVLLNNVLRGATTLVLLLFLAAVAGPAWSYRSALKAKKTADEKAHFLAAHDPLTGLYNRNSFLSQLEKNMSGGDEFALHFLDIDNFKQINDKFGHGTGDTILSIVAQRLRNLLGESTVITRIGGDEFAVIQTGANDHRQVDDLAGKILTVLKMPFVVGEHSVVASVSVGSAIAPRDGKDAARLMKSADLAMYQAKAEGRDRNRHFELWMDHKLAARREIESRLRWALENDGFKLNYQPLYSSVDNSLLGFEALLRLGREDGTMIPPDSFIPVAEEIRLIEEIGTWVLNTGCKFAASWPHDLKLAVNLSVGQFFSGNLVSDVQDALASSGLAPSRLELEITESLLVDDSDSNLEQLQALKRLGVSIAMDDFGTGYSSLSYLWQFPFDKIKIDRSFMSGFESQSPRITRILETIVGLGHTLDMQITAEGVETDDQVEMLKKINCDQIQGFLYGRPMSDIATVQCIIEHQATSSGKPSVVTPKRVPAA
ncbi:putative bifunctional diguanylate cyclase/phosphodiesterase [Roseibium sp.]|uniref:putative bifunctional diguanylate cyclase/phosphodiesterase n=1 Tax=Roseibium sp. TaxID=1936156 RepID=UPI003A97EFA5